MRKIILIFYLAVFIVILTSCNKGVEPADNRATVYFNSFETSADTAGWAFVASCTLVNERGGDYGAKSMHIAGGCLQPAASYIISNVQANRLKVGFWGKVGAEYMSAGITLRFVDNGITKSLPVAVNSTQWKYYEAEIDTGTNTTVDITLQVFAGGIIANDLYLDNLRIEKI